MLTSSHALLFAASLALSSGPGGIDSDSDGLSDFLEVHKYLTDPQKADSDGDGIPDGDWLERREYAYTVRSLVQVMRPVTPEFLNDAYQDVRVLDETDTYVELEVIHYPLVDLKGVGADGESEDVARWLEPGPTSNASRDLGQAIRAAMKKSGEGIPDLRGAGGVAAAAKWLLDHAKYKDRFTTFITAVDAKGAFFIPEDLAAYARKKASGEGLTAEDAWPREFEAAGMFEHGERGSCSSSAIYLSGCLRALGVPTRTVLCIPIIDAGDDREWELLERGLHHNGVRTTLEAALDGSRRGWSSHTFNEVYVEGRWHRLNYSDMDAGVFHEGFFGLMTHVATFHDWADARMWETIGRRSTLSNDDKEEDVFGHQNPYSTLALRDSFGVHGKVRNPPLEDPVITVEALYWTDSKELPDDILRSNQDRGRLGLIAAVSARSMGDLVKQLKRADNEVTLTTDGSNEIKASFHPGCIWLLGQRGYLYAPIDKASFEKIAEGTTCRATTREHESGPRWILDRTITR
ncbi:Transglutaminase-like superfamily protein [Planctomycetes bacterium Poly30]|uniref:Transglutaminase-like superfamily protein n=1 Tax=Saltatorellus ferox TaxID=2528018 RepID=A0A518ESA5_9BACT|nr:Transglutaminase-like superfamily protein [Planctomycetes bacterium Poly30]